MVIYYYATWVLKNTVFVQISQPLFLLMVNLPKSKRCHNKEIYDIVLKSQRAAMDKIKTNIPFNVIQDESFRVILEGLRDLGLIQGSLEDLMKNNVHYTFMPHSLGHYIGYKTHDVGFQRSIYDDQEGLFTPEDYKKYDPITLANIYQGIVTTIEPGIYFIPSLFDKAAANENKKQYFNFEKIAEYTEVGGVRIEDMVWIKKDGYELLTHVI